MENSGKEKKLKSLIWSVLLLIYLGVRFGATSFLDGLNEYASYYFEVIFLCLAILLQGREFFNFFKVNLKLAFIAFLALVLGLLSFKGMNFLSISSPFDFKNKEILVFLFIVAPFLEEGLFRFFIWEPFHRINNKLAYGVSSLLFSYSHFHAFWFVPEQLHSFIFYQSAYTLLLALLCGLSVFRFQSLLGAILIHFSFNLGFYFGSF